MMSRISIHVCAVAAVALFAAACGELNTDELTDDLSGVELAGEGAKADSSRLPTPQGELRGGAAVSKSLSRGAGYHLYTYAGRSGAKVTFVLKSRAYRTYLRVTSPAGTRWNVAGVKDRTGTYVATVELTLRSSGTYKVLGTSYNNMFYGIARSTGEYTLSATASSQFCGGIAGFQCPTGLKCLLDGNYPDAGGTCVAQDACRVPNDCEGIPHIECVGAWSCNGATASAPGTCAYACRQASECDGLDVSRCSANPRCAIVARGCENNHCDPEVGPCHACDPIAVCEPKQAGHEGDGCGGRNPRPCGDGLYCSFTLAAICGWADAGGTCAPRPQICTAQYDPVCGCDRRTYSNTCAAASAGTSVSARGQCARP